MFSHCLLCKITKKLKQAEKKYENVRAVGKKIIIASVQQS